MIVPNKPRAGASSRIGVDVSTTVEQIATYLPGAVTWCELEISTTYISFFRFNCVDGMMICKLSTSLVLGIGWFKSRWTSQPCRSPCTSDKAGSRRGRR